MTNPIPHDPPALGASEESHPHLPSVSVENVSRRYEPVRVRRLEVIFSVLGGIVPGEDAVPEDEEEFEDDEEAPERLTGAKVALEDVSFAVAGGTCLALVGPTLAGKSVLMRIIAGIAPPTSGRVVIHGRVAPVLASTLGVFPRFGRVRGTLPSLAVLLGIPAREARTHFGEIVEFLEQPELPRKHVSLLSKEHKRALLLALALHANADVLLIDAEIPKGELGVRCRERLIELKRAGVLIILTGQTVESVSWLADRVIHIESGGVVGEERVDQSYETDPEASAAAQTPT